MIKKYFISLIICFIFLFTGSAFATIDDAKPVMQPLKIEQENPSNNNYGNFKAEYEKKNVQSQDFKGILPTSQEDDKREKSVFEIFTSLMFVIILIFICAWVYMRIKKINPQQLLEGKFNNLNDNTFRILSSMSLGGGKNIYLIEINSTQLIVGTTPQNVTLLSQMNKASEASPQIDKKVSQECLEKLFQDKTEEFKKLEE